MTAFVSITRQGTSTRVICRTCELRSLDYGEDHDLAQLDASNHNLLHTAGDALPDGGTVY